MKKMDLNKVDWRKVGQAFTIFSIVGSVGSYLLDGKIQQQNMQDAVAEYMKAQKK